MSKDLFSGQAALYKQYRPGYPAALFDYITGFVNKKDTAWDCATGNGQAALVLKNYFKRIYATDISQKQLDQAVQDERITYLLCSAEKTDFPRNSFDLITVAQAYHWFRFEVFEQEVKRVARPGAIIAVWGYSLAESSNKDINRLVLDLYSETLGTYWDDERKYVEDHYASAPFPYEELPGKTFSIDVSWNKARLLGYLHSWSSVQKFISSNNYDPLDQFAADLDRIWTDHQQEIIFKFPVFLRIGRIL